MSANEKEPGPDHPETVVQEEPKKKREYKDFGHEEEKATRKSCLLVLPFSLLIAFCRRQGRYEHGMFKFEAPLCLARSLGVDRVDGRRPVRQGKGRFRNGCS